LAVTLNSIFNAIAAKKKKKSQQYKEVKSFFNNLFYYFFIIIFLGCVAGDGSMLPVSGGKSGRDAQEMQRHHTHSADTVNARTVLGFWGRSKGE
jgi:hypothetical protein